jgi:hypothetical protein
MRETLLTMAVALLCSSVSSAQYSPTWRLRHYDLDYEILPGERVYRGAATLTLENVSGRTQKSVPLALYRLQDAEAVEDGDGSPLRFTAAVVKAPDWLGFQALSIDVELRRPAEPGEVTRLRVRHGGPMLGYEEVKRYTKDRIAGDLSVLRQDTLAYPQLGPVTDRDLSGNLQAQIAQGWSFRVAVTVPKPLVVAASGRRTGCADVDAKRWRYEFESSLLTWRIDVAAADYRVVERTDRGLTAYVFPADVGAAEAALSVMAKSIDAFTRWFGPVPGAGYTLIEVPEGYGSQAATGYFVQTADALKKPDELRDLAHEISHAWNAPSREENVSRFLDEAFATYFQALVDDVLVAPGAKASRLETYRRRYLRQVDAHPQWGTVPIADYGRADLTDLSYMKGPWVLAVLDETIGHDSFLKAVRTFLGRYRDSGAKLPDFKAVAEEVSGRRLDTLWSEWIEQGEPSTTLLRQNSEPARIADRYR